MENKEKESNDNNFEKILFSTDFAIENEEEAFLLGYHLGRK